MVEEWVKQGEDGVGGGWIRPQRGVGSAVEHTKFGPSSRTNPPNYRAT